MDCHYFTDKMIRHLLLAAIVIWFSPGCQGRSPWKGRSTRQSKLALKQVKNSNHFNFLKKKSYLLVKLITFWLFKRKLIEFGENQCLDYHFWWPRSHIRGGTSHVSTRERSSGQVHIFGQLPDTVPLARVEKKGSRSVPTWKILRFWRLRAQGNLPK